MARRLKLAEEPSMIVIYALAVALFGIYELSRSAKRYFRFKRRVMRLRNVG